MVIRYYSRIISIFVYYLKNHPIYQQIGTILKHFKKLRN